MRTMAGACRVVQSIRQAAGDERDRARANLGATVMARLSAEAVAVALGLEKHPEGGRFKEIYRRVVGPGERGGMTSIY